MTIISFNLNTILIYLGNKCGGFFKIYIKYIVGVLYLGRAKCKSILTKKVG